MIREVQPPRPRHSSLILACLLTACVSTAVHQSLRPSPGVPPSVLNLQFTNVCDSSWLAPAYLCAGRTALSFDGCHWSCVGRGSLVITVPE